MQKSKPSQDVIAVGGMRSSVDPQFQPENSYRLNINGRVLFNEGADFSWEVEKGTIISFTLVEHDGAVLSGYEVIGSAMLEDKLILFSTDEINSEIGFVEINTNGIGQYQQVYNDKYDPNNELLGFTRYANIHAVAIRETPDIERVYFNDFKSERRSLNILLGKELVDGPYTPNGITNNYTFWYSAHQIARQASINYGKLIFQEKISNGSLKTGKYAYSYRQRTRDGYATPWYPVTKPVFLNDTDVDPSNQNQYQQNQSNIVTVYGHRLILDEIDRRFPILEVAYVYYADAQTPAEATIFETNDFGDTAPSTSFTVNHTQHSGDPVALEELSRRYQAVDKALVALEQDNLLFEGNIVTRGLLEPDLSGAEIQPLIRNMRVDGFELDDGATFPGKLQGTPFVHVNPVTETLTKRNYTVTNPSSVDFGVNRTQDHEIVNDYPHYKGQQWEHLFASYWRGETYRFAVVVFDLKGMPSFAFHLDDYKFPDQDSGANDYRLTELNGATSLYEMRILGALVNGVNIPKAVAFDTDGNLRISGFSIVRADRVPKTLFQGVIMNTVFEDTTETDSDGNNYRDFTRPLPFTTNKFNTLADIEPGSRQYDQILSSRNNTSAIIHNRPGAFLLYSPDVMFESVAAPERQDSDRVRLVGFAADPFTFRSGATELLGNQDHFYSKNYETGDPGWSLTNLRTDKGVAVGADSLVERYSTPVRTTLSEEGSSNIENYDYHNADLTFKQKVNMGSTDPDVGVCPTFNALLSNTAKKGHGVQNALLIQLSGFDDLGVTAEESGVEFRSTFFIANYERPIGSYYGDSSDADSIERTLYKGLGHFQPITNSEVNDCLQADGSLLFDGIEIWGGDCYPFLFDFARIVPRFSNCDEVSSCKRDYAVSMVVPLEASINFAMRRGRQFADVGTSPEDTACDSGTTDFPDGISEYQREDFSLSAVMREESPIQQFIARPSDFKDNTEYPHRWIYSQTKFYGESIDNYTINLEGDFLDLFGRHGDIRGAFQLYSYVYSLQERGFSRLLINERALVDTNTQGSLLLGTGGTLAGALYISKEIGCQHRFSVAVSGNSAMWIDAHLSKQCRFGQNGLVLISDAKDQHDFFDLVTDFYRDPLHRLDNPSGSGGIICVFDQRDMEFITTFVREPIPVGGQDVPDTGIDFNRTIIYSEAADYYHLEHSETPNWWMSFREFVFAPNPANQAGQEIHVMKLGVRGEFFGVLKDSLIRVVFNSGVDIPKVFDNCSISVDGSFERITSIDMETLSQSVSFSLVGDARKRYRNQLLTFPTRSTDQVDRMRGRYMVLTLNISNDGDNSAVRISGIESKFRVSHKI